MRDTSNKNQEKSAGVVYSITLRHNGTDYIYIGRTRQKVTKRLEDHNWNLRSGKHKNVKFQVVFDSIFYETKIYPKLTWRILDSGNYTNKELSLREEWYTEIYKDKYGDTILNIHVGDQVPESRLDQMIQKRLRIYGRIKNTRIKLLRVLGKMQRIPNIGRNYRGPKQKTKRSRGTFKA